MVAAAMAVAVSSESGSVMGAASSLGALCGGSAVFAVIAAGLLGIPVEVLAGPGALPGPAAISSKRSVRTSFAAISRTVKMPARSSTATISTFGLRASAARAHSTSCELRDPHAPSEQTSAQAAQIFGCISIALCKGSVLPGW
jgi:hypothetical protein